MSVQAASTSFFQTWINALTKPNERTYSEMAASPNAKAMTAYIWVFICVLVEGFFALLVQSTFMREMMIRQGLVGRLPAEGLGTRLITLVCGAPIGALITVVIFAIFTALMHWIAKMFGGRGTFDQLAYAFGAIVAPYFLISTVFVLLAAIPVVGLCFGILNLVFFIYVLVLNIIAAKGIEQVGWGGAVGAVLIPFAAVFLICCCLLVVISALTGAALGNIFSTLNQSLPGY